MYIFIKSEPREFSNIFSFVTEFHFDLLEWPTIKTLWILFFNVACLSILDGFVVYIIVLGI